MSRAVIGIVAICAVDERNIVPDLAVGDGVLELSVFASKELVRLADLDSSRRVAERLRVLRSSGNLDGAGRVGLVDRPNPHVVRAAVADDSIASYSKGCLKSGSKESKFGKHLE